MGRADGELRDQGVLRQIGYQDDRPRHVLGRDHGGAGLGAGVHGALFDDRGVDLAGDDDAGAQPAIPELGVQILGEVDHACLGCGKGRAADQAAAHAGQRGNIDDGARAGGLHGGHHRLSAVDGARQIGVDGGADILGRGGEQHAVGR